MPAVTPLLPRIPRDHQAVAAMMIRHFGDQAAAVAWKRVTDLMERDLDGEASRAWEAVAGALSAQAGGE
jgi:hypothetical protein